MQSAAATIAEAALARVQDPATRGVRVEDYLTALAAVSGEAVLISAGLFDIETSDIAPGAPVFGDRINELLTGDTTELNALPPSSAAGILVAELVPDVVPAQAFGSLEALYKGVAERVGSGGWGRIATTVPEANQPTIVPIQVAFELRPAVEAAIADSGLEPAHRYVPCAIALSLAVKQVREAIDLAIAMRLALEVLFGAAKMMPMSQRRFEQMKGASGAQ